jgi:hypothetical protein
METYLEGFQQRMLVVGIVESIVNRRGRNTEIEQLFAPHILTNLVFSVLLFIMEKTLTEDAECDKKLIQQFLDRLLLDSYKRDLGEEQLEKATEYIIKTILQNDGEAYFFTTMDYEKKQRVKLSIRLIDDHLQKTSSGYKLSYSLSDQGYDFLFRTKEVDEAMKFPMAELKLRELIKRKNFGQASKQSDELIQMVRQKKQEVQALLLRIKEDIDTIDVAEQERLVRSTYELLSDEYDIMNELSAQVNRAERQIRNDFKARKQLDEELKKAQSSLYHIKENLRIIISEQRKLLVNQSSLTELYVQTLEESFAYQSEKRFDFEEVILRGMESHPEAVGEFWRLLNPLFLPNTNRHLNIQRLFAQQGMMKLAEENRKESLMPEGMAEDLERKRVEGFQTRYREIVGGLTAFARKSAGRIRLSEWINDLRKEAEVFGGYMEERLLFTTVLRLYDLGEIDLLALWQEEDRLLSSMTDEFDPELCFLWLRDADADWSHMRKLQVEKIDDKVVEVEWTLDRGELKTLERVTMTDFQIRVEWDHE